MSAGFTFTSRVSAPSRWVPHLGGEQVDVFRAVVEHSFPLLPTLLNLVSVLCITRRPPLVLLLHLLNLLLLLVGEVVGGDVGPLPLLHGGDRQLPAGLPRARPLPDCKSVVAAEPRAATTPTNSCAGFNPSMIQYAAV